MVIISHRGNIYDKNLELENTKAYILKAINLGFDVEVDIKFENNKFVLGHDWPIESIDSKWILDYSSKLLFHCKNLNSAFELLNLNSEMNLFCHKSDPYVLISNGLIWVDDKNLTLNQKCIIPIFEKNNIYPLINKIYGICVDHCIHYKNQLENYGLK